MKSIYIDSLFFVNLLADYLLCLVSARFCSLSLKRLRYLAAAFFGAAYSVCVFLPGLGFLAMPMFKLVSACLMGLIAFGGEKKLLRCTAVLLAVSATFGGAIWAISMRVGSAPAVDVPLLLSSFAVCYVLLSLISRGRRRRREGGTVQAELILGERSCSFRALIDTGNSLADPISGASVMLVSPAALAPLLPEDAWIFSLTDAVELLEASERVPELCGRMRLISYSAVGGKGMLAVMKTDGIKIDGKPREGLLAAISESASGDGFEAIL